MAAGFTVDSENWSEVLITFTHVTSERLSILLQKGPDYKNKEIHTKSINHA